MMDKIQKITGFAAVLLLLIVTLAQAGPSCKGLTETCSSNTDCCDTYLTDHGAFYGYCQSTCKAADGINGNMDQYNACLAKDGSVDPNQCKVFATYSDPTGIPGGQNGFWGKYDYAGKMLETQDENQLAINKQYYDYMGFGGAYAQWSKTTGQSQVSFDPLGKMLKATDAKGNYVQKTYDALQRLTKEQYFTAGGVNDFTVTYSYDKDFSGATCAESGSSLNLLCEVVDYTTGNALNSKIKMIYDSRGRPTTVEKTINDKSLGQRKYALTYAYDSANNLLSMKLPSGKTVKYTYDSLNRLQQLDYQTDEILANPSMESGQTGWGILPANVISTSCHTGSKCAKGYFLGWEFGQLVKLERSTTYKISYWMKKGTEAFSRVGIYVQDNVNGVPTPKDIGYCLHAATTNDWEYQECEITTPSTLLTEENMQFFAIVGGGNDPADQSRYVYYDDLSLKKKIGTDPNAQYEPIASFDYGPSGEILQKKLAPASSNSLVAAYSYDELTRPTSIYYSLGSAYNPASPILQESLKYDAVGNVLQISDAVDLANPGNIIGNIDSFAYDNLYRLKSATYVNDKAFTFNYRNLLGDRSDKTIVSATTGTETTTYRDYDSGDKLKEFVVAGSASAGSTSLNYDENGNVVSANGPGKSLTLKYDSLNRVTQSNNINDYSYDYQNLRVKKKTALGTTFYLYQGNNVIYEDFIPSGICQQTCGDLNGDAKTNIVDLTYLVNYLFSGGPQPKYLCSADVDKSTKVNVLDLTYYVNFLFKGGPTVVGQCTSDPSLSNDPTGGWTYDRVQTYISGAQTAS
ncbi:hypothetical protein HY989_04045 [Candidatus Micrarchaeota archaeon]|nr:hypothetical protein [Candidatus Micrarchaeota archaeon]